MMIARFDTGFFSCEKHLRLLLLLVTVVQIAVDSFFHSPHSSLRKVWIHLFYGLNRRVNSSLPSYVAAGHEEYERNNDLIRLDILKYESFFVEF